MPKAETVLQLDPAEVEAVNNVRYALTPESVANMAADIQSAGQILQPVTVVKNNGDGGLPYRLVSGFRRHAAAAMIRSNGDPSFTLPAVLGSSSDETVILRQRILENMAREAMSPMDEAVAIKQLQESGTPKRTIMDMFPTLAANGTRIPASYAKINMRLSFLNFPKTIQDLIHTGVLGVSGAYKLSKAPKEQWKDIVAAAKEARERELAAEQKGDAAISEVEEKVSDNVKRVEALTNALTETERKAAEADAAADSLMEAVTKAYADEKKAKGAEKKLAVEHRKALEAELKKAEDAQTQAHNTKKIQRGQLDKLSKTGEDLKAKLAERRDDVPKPGKAKKAGPLSDKDIDTAAAAKGGERVKRTASEMRKCAEELASMVKLPKISAVGGAFVEFFNGGTQGALLKALGAVVGEAVPASRARQQK